MMTRCPKCGADDTNVGTFARGLVPPYISGPKYVKRTGVEGDSYDEKLRYTCRCGYYQDYPTLDAKETK